MPLTSTEKVFSHGLLDGLIRAGLIVVLAVSCYRVFQPFLDLLLWSVILAITLYPLHALVMRKLHLRDGWAATLLVVVAIALLSIPVYVMALSVADSAGKALAVARSGNFHVPAPADSVATWPLVGKKLHALWLQAATDLTGVLQAFAPQVKAFVLAALGKVAGLGLALLLFVGALVIAAIVMAFAQAGERSSVRIGERLFGPGRGQEIATLCTSTVRAVAQGVIGIAFIQALLVGVGFVMVGVPGAGLLTLAILLLGILQIPATLVTIPVIAYVFATQGASTGTIVFAIYAFVAGLVDNVLKPLMLGRGVAVPMPVILIGVIGGMITNGLIGLFTGPVLLAVGYVLFWQWVDDARSLPVGDAADVPANPPSPA
jgi:predicted PurR-regulated permease PerM